VFGEVGSRLQPPIWRRDSFLTSSESRYGRCTENIPDGTSGRGGGLLAIHGNSNSLDCLSRARLSAAWRDTDFVGTGYLYHIRATPGPAGSRSVGGD
jgi:hypothetical protein